jgi:carboxypeptidase Taq
MTTVQAHWEKIQERVRELSTLGQVAQLLEWDQGTMMPTAGDGLRGAHLSVLSGLIHERLTDPALGDWLDAMTGQLDPVKTASVQKLRRRHTRATKIPTALVRDLTSAANDGFGAWLKAKEADDFRLFQPHLERLVDLRLEEVAHLGPAAHPYDHLLEDYDPGARTAELRPLFKRLSGELTNFLRAIEGLPGPDPLDTHFDLDGQSWLSEQVLKQIGFRMDAGRLDLAAHPFTVSLGPDDVRLTTRYDAHDLFSGLGSTIHEGGHGMYEQGLPQRWLGTGLDEAAGMAMHESQSRFWENTIGRSQPFMRWLSGLIDERWPQAQLSPERLYAAANRVAPSLIRVEADEVTYNLHIAIRFELELALIDGSLSVADLPDAWNSAYSDRLGITPTGPATGVLQDVHWSQGLFGYFPSYTLGNLYAASLRYRMEEDLPKMWDEVENGVFSSVLGWLHTHVHDQGHLQDAPELMRKIVGDRDPVNDLMQHIHTRHGALYGVAKW